MTAALVVALPLLGALVALGVGHQASAVASLAAVASCAAAWVASVVLAVGQLGDAAVSVVGPYEIPTGGIPIQASLYVDQLSVSMLLLATTVATLVQVYSVAYLRGDPRYPSYAALVCIFTAAMGLVVAADDLFVLLVGWEVMGACSYFLISHHWELAEARAGAVKAFLMTRLGDVGLLFGIFVAGQAAGTYRISGVVEAARSGGITHGQATLASLLLLCGVVGKSAQFPLHTWLPDAMPGPTPISALIHAATMVAAGVFLVARLLPLFVLSTATMTVLALIATVTMLGSALMACVADDLKRLLAWSTVSQLSYMFAALSVGGYAAGVLHLLSHGAFKALLFLAAGSVIRAVGTQRLDSMGGLRASMPVTFATMTIGFAALAGLPPFVGFFSKDAVLGLAADEAFQGEQGVRPWLVLVVGFLVAGLTAAYATRAWLLIFFGRSRSDAGVAQPSEQGWLMLGPLVVLAAASTLGGAAVVAPHFLGVGSEPLHVATMVVSTVVTVGAAGFTTSEWWRLDGRDPARIFGRLRPALDGELGFDAGVVARFARPVSLLSGLVMTSEADVVEPYAAGADTGAQWSGRLLRWLHNGDPQRYITAVVLGAAAVALVVGMVQ